MFSLQVAIDLEEVSNINGDGETFVQENAVRQVRWRTLKAFINLHETSLCWAQVVSYTGFARKPISTTKKRYVNNELGVHCYHILPL